jgi:hypothetical protein
LSTFCHKINASPTLFPSTLLAYNGQLVKICATILWTLLLPLELFLPSWWGKNINNQSTNTKKGKCNKRKIHKFWNEICEIMILCLWFRVWSIVDPRKMLFVTHLLAFKYLNLPQIISIKKTPRNHQGDNYNVFCDCTQEKDTQHT